MLSNWYVRRSRRRFWKSESDTGQIIGLQHACYHAVRHGLDINRRRFMPYLAEEMYQNLVLFSG